MIWSGKVAILSFAIVVSLCASLAFMFPTTVHAKMYKWVDDQGKTHFTNSPGKVPLKYRNQKSGKPKPKIDISNTKTQSRLSRKTRAPKPSDCDAMKNSRGQYLLQASDLRYNFYEPEKSELTPYYFDESGSKERPPSCSVLEALIINHLFMSEAQWLEMYAGKSLEGEGFVNVPLANDGTVQFWVWLKAREDSDRRRLEGWKLNLVLRVKNRGQISKVRKGKKIHYRGKISNFKVKRYKRKHKGVVNQETDYYLHVDGNILN